MKESIAMTSYLYDALIVLLTKKSFEEITIQELVQKAGVSRMTYYRHFASKEEILLNRLDHFFSNYYEEMLAYDGKVEEHLRLRFFDYFEAEKDLVKALMQAHLEQELFLVFRDYLKVIFSELIVSNESRTDLLHYETSFLAGGLLQILLTWVSGDCQTPKKDLSLLIERLLRANER